MSEADDGDDDGDLTLPILGGIAIGLPLAIVLGLVLLVVLAIVAVFVVILLSAILGSFVLGVGDDVSTTPQAQFEFADGSNQVTVQHVGGDQIQAGRLRVEVNGQARGTWAELGGTDTIEAGDSIDVEDVGPGDTIRLIYSGEDGSSLLASYEAG